MSEPRTEAGRRVWDEITASIENGGGLHLSVADILAIEAEAVSLRSEPDEGLLARAMEVARPAIEKANSVGLRYQAIHDDAFCARDEHGCGCLCHAAAAILREYRDLAACSQGAEAMTGLSTHRVYPDGPPCSEECPGYESALRSEPDEGLREAAQDLIDDFDAGGEGYRLHLSALRAALATKEPK